MIDKYELAKQGTLVPNSPDIYKIDEDRYVILSAPGNVIINTSRAFKTKEENKPVLKSLGRLIGRKLIEQELRKQGVDINDLTDEEIRSVVRFV